MANWLERAKREIPQNADQATAKTAEGNPTAVTAVPELDKPEIPRGSIGSNGSARATDFQRTVTAVAMSAGDEEAIRAWLAHIDETDEAIIAEVLNRCRRDAEVRDYFVMRANEVSIQRGTDDATP